MTQIKITDDEKFKVFETTTTFEDVSFIINNLLKKQDAYRFLKAIPEELQTHLQATFSVSIKEFNTFFKHKFEATSFIEAMIKFGYLIKYHTTYKVTTKYLEDIATIISPNLNVLHKFSLNENILFNETLGFDCIKYMINSKNFQQSNFVHLLEITKKEAIDILDYLIYYGYLTKTGTTYCVTEKFKKKAYEYQELFTENNQ